MTGDGAQRRLRRIEKAGKEGRKMKKVMGWILIIFGGFFCVVSVICIPVVFAAENIAWNSWGERLLALAFFAASAAVDGLICWMGFKLKAPKT